VYDGAPESKKELRWTELNSLSPFPGFFYEILLEHCAKKSAVADSLLCSEAAQNSLQKPCLQIGGGLKRPLMIKMNIKKTRSLLLKPQILFFGF
jgi:hypothetical protein